MRVNPFTQFVNDIILISEKNRKEYSDFLNIYKRRIDLDLFFLYDLFIAEPIMSKKLVFSKGESHETF